MGTNNDLRSRFIDKWQAAGRILSIKPARSHAGVRCLGDKIVEDQGNIANRRSLFRSKRISSPSRTLGVQSCAMQSVVINNPQARRFPFPRDIFEDSLVLYHGSWSNWSRRIEQDGLTKGHTPFDWRHVAPVVRAHKAIGWGSFVIGRDEPRGNEASPRDVSFSPNFWRARAYSTDSGGEVVRMTIEAAKRFESLCTDPKAREREKARCQHGLTQCPTHLVSSNYLPMRKL